MSDLDDLRVPAPVAAAYDKALSAIAAAAAGYPADRCVRRGRTRATTW